MKNLLYGVFLLLCVFGWNLSDAQIYQTWRTEATDNIWQTDGNWWNFPNGSPIVFGQQEWDNNYLPAQISSADVNTWRFLFKSGASGIHSFSGNRVRFFDFSGNNPSITNESVATHIINNNIEGDGTADDPLEIQINGSGGLTLTGNVNNQGSFIDVIGSTTSAANITFSGEVSGAGGFYKNNSNTTLLLSAANTYTGQTIIDAGIVRINNANGLGNISAGTVVNTGAVLELNASANYPAEPLTLKGTGISNNGALRKIDTNPRSFGGSVLLGSDARINVTGGTLEFTGLMNLASNTLYIGGTLNFAFLPGSSVSGADKTSGDGAILKDGSGMLLFRPSTAISGNITLVSGEIRQSLNDPFSTAGLLIFQGGVYRSDGGVARSVQKPTRVDADFTIGHLGGGSITFTSPMNLNGGARTLTMENLNTISGAISNGSLFKAGSGTLVLNAANTFEGVTRIIGGTLNLTNTNALQNSTLEMTTGDFGVLQFNSAGTYTLGALSGTRNITLSPPTITLRIGNNNSNTVYSGSITGGNIEKVGAGVLTVLGTGLESQIRVTQGTFRLGGNERIADYTTLILNGGTFSTGAPGGFNEAMGSVTLNENSTIELGSGIHVLNFPASNLIPWVTGKVLTITGWTGSSGFSGTSGQIFFGNTVGGLTNDQLDQINFTGYSSGATILASGEVVPRLGINIVDLSTPPFVMSECSSAVAGIITYEVDAPFSSGNIFTAVISDASGSFAQGLAIGSVTATGNGTINITVPENLPSGTGYRIRIEGSNPATLGAPSSSFEIIQNGEYCPREGDFRTINSGDWTIGTNWQIYTYNAGTKSRTWITQSGSIQPANAAVNVYVRNGHQIALNAATPASLLNLIVDAGGQLFRNSSEVTNLRYINLGGDIVCNGIIGNGTTSDAIGFNIQEGTHTIKGTGDFDCWRIRLSNEQNNGAVRGDATLVFARNVNLRWPADPGDGTNAIFNGSAVNSFFTVIVNNGVTLRITNPNASFGMDGPVATAFAATNAGGSYFVSGTIDCAGRAILGSNSSDIYRPSVLINSGGTVFASHMDYGPSNIPNGGTLSIFNGGELNITGAGTDDFAWLTTSGTITYSVQAGSTVQYSRLGDQKFPALFNYSNLIFSGSGTKSFASTASNSIGNWTLRNTASCGALTIGSTLSVTGNILMENSSNFSSSAFDNLSITLGSFSSQVFTGNGQAIRCYNFTSAKTNYSLTLDPNTPLDVKNTFQMDQQGGASSFLNDGGNTISVGNDLTLIGLSPRWILSGTFILTGENDGTNTIGANAGSAFLGEFNNLVIKGSGTVDGTQFLPLTGGQNITIKGNLSIENTTPGLPGVLNAMNNNIILRGNWTNYNQSGFAEGSSRISLTGTGNQTITCGGGEVFHKLTINKSSGIVFLGNDLSLNGAGVGASDAPLIFSQAIQFDLQDNVVRMNGLFGHIRIPATGTVLVRGSDGTFEVDGNNGDDKEVVSVGGQLHFDAGVTVNLRRGLNFGLLSQMRSGSVLQISNNGSVQFNPPLYANGSTLRYATTGPYIRGNEWNSPTAATPGYPHHVEISGTYLELGDFATPADKRIGGDLSIFNGGTLDMGVTSRPLVVAGSVDIGNATSAGTLNLGFGASINGDLRVGGDLVRNALGIFNQNNREVEMNGVGPGNVQNIENIASFDYLAINNTGGSVVPNGNTGITERLRLSNGIFNPGSFDVVIANESLILRSEDTSTMTKFPVVSGADQYDVEYSVESMSVNNEWTNVNTSVRDIRITGTSGTPITLSCSDNRTFNRNLRLEHSNLNLATFEVTARGQATEPAFSGSIDLYGGGTRSILGSSGSAFNITGLGGNDPSKFTKTVSSFGGTTLVFGPDVTVRLGDGATDFGFTAGLHPTTVQGTLEILLGGSVGLTLNPCYYAVGSTLKFFNNIDFSVGANNKTWTLGSITSGLPGIPWNVLVDGAGTQLELFETRAIRNNLTISNGGEVECMPSFTGSLNIGGSWSNHSEVGFVEGNTTVVFDGTGTQNITCPGGEVFNNVVFRNSGQKVLNNNIATTDLRIDAGSGIVQGGSHTITLGSDWTNNQGPAAFNEATSTVIFNGSSAPNTIVANGGEDFHNLVLNNTSGDIGLELEDGISIGGVMTFSNGIVQAGTNEVEFKNGATYADAGGQSYVNGVVRKIGTTINTPFIFPVGDYRQVTLDSLVNVYMPAAVVPMATDANAAFTGSYRHENRTPGYTSDPNNQHPSDIEFKSVSTCNFWDITRVGSVQAKVRLYWDDASGCYQISDPMTLLVAHLDTGAPNWDYTGEAQVVSDPPYSSGYVESLLPINTFSPFSIGSGGVGNVLPITLLSFTARAINNEAVTAHWVTASEVNNDYFTVERSTDAQHWQVVGTVQGAGNSTTTLNYTFTDTAPYTGLSYYRLKQTDFDGTATYSHIEAVMIKGFGDGLFDLHSVFRTETALDFTYTSLSPYLTVEIFDISGRMVHGSIIENYEGQNRSSLDVSLARGVYVLRLTEGDVAKSMRFFY